MENTQSSSKKDNSLDLINIESLNNLINNSYFKESLYIDNTFTVFKSINDILYLIYSNENKSIISYNLIEKKVINEVKNAHDYLISNFIYYLDKINKRDLILSISCKNNNIKLWNFNNFECLLNIENIYNGGFIFSACFLNDNNHIYIITSNYKIDYFSFEYIKVFNLNGQKINQIDHSEENSNYIMAYYDNKTSKNYIISANNGNVKSFDFKENELYNIYNDGTYFNHNSVVINSKEDIVKLIESCNDGNIRIWNFHSAQLLNIIHITDKYLIGLCLWNNDYLLVGREDTIITIIDLNKEFIVNQLTGHNNSVLTIKNIIHPQYGKILISQGCGNDGIKLWLTKN